MGETSNAAGSAPALTPREKLLRWAASQRQPLVGDSPLRLAELVERAVLYHLAPDDLGFAADIGVHKSPEVQAAVKAVKAKLPALVKRAADIVKLGAQPNDPAGWASNVDGLRFLLHAAFDPQGQQGEEVMDFTQRVASALEVLAALPLTLPPGRQGAIQRDDAVTALVKAVCVYRQEMGLSLAFDFKILKGAGEAYRQVDTDTAALMVKVADLWAMEAMPKELRTMLRSFGDEIKERGSPPTVEDILWWSDSGAAGG